jgi:flagellar motor switch protein FliN/FliY
MSAATTTETLPNLNIVLDVAVNVSVELGGCQLPMREVLQLAPGSVVHLNKASDAPVDLCVNGKKFARGEVVVVEGRIGIKITELLGASA